MDEIDLKIILLLFNNSRLTYREISDYFILFDYDLNLSKYRFQKNWQNEFEYCLDSEKTQEKHLINQDLCSMCGEYCALSLTKRFFSAITKSDMK